MLSKVAEIFDIRREIDTATDLGFCVDSVSNLNCFIFAPTSICPIFMLF